MKKKISKIITIMIILLTIAFISLGVMLKQADITKTANYGLQTFAKAAYISADDKLNTVKSTYGDGTNLRISEREMSLDSNLFCNQFGVTLGDDTKKGTYPINKITEHQAIIKNVLKEI